MSMVYDVIFRFSSSIQTLNLTAEFELDLTVSLFLMFNFMSGFVLFLFCFSP